VINDDALAELDEGRREILEQAAAQTREWAIETIPNDADAAKAYCENGGAVVLATETDVAALERAAASVYAELERDPQTNELIDRIRTLKSDVAPANTPAACKESAGVTPTGSVADAALNGVWRANPTYEEGRAAGLSAKQAADEMGVGTIRMEDGNYDWTWLSRNGEKRCSGTYVVSGERVVFTDPPECGHATWGARFEVDGDRVRWRDVTTSEKADPWDLVVRKLLLEPWTKIAEVDTNAFPEGVYRTELPYDELRAHGLSENDARANEGIQTLTLDSGRWSHEARNSTSPPTCSGPYTMDGTRVVLTFDSTVDRCGTAGDTLFSAEWTLENGLLRFTEVRDGTTSTDEFLSIAWGGRPWMRIADAKAVKRAFPEGVYRYELPFDYLLSKGFTPQQAREYQGIHTFTFERGRWFGETKRNPFNPPPCNGRYTVSGRRVSLTHSCGGVKGETLFSGRWKLEGRTLRFTAVRDGRGRPLPALEGRAWKKLR
jgi:hypothetical protein